MGGKPWYVECVNCKWGKLWGILCRDRIVRALGLVGGVWPGWFVVSCHVAALRDWFEALQY